MNVRSPTQTKTQPTFTPVQTGVLQRKCASCGQHTIAGGECKECQKKRSLLQRRSANESEPSEVPSIVHEVLRSPGQPLDSRTRTFMESGFEHDFSQVRVHTDGKAAKSARAVNALAYTVGQNVVFNSGQYAPETTSGKRLLAHELTHVIQQRKGGNSLQTFLKINSANDAYEREADRTSHLVTDRHALTVDRHVVSSEGIGASAVPLEGAVRRGSWPLFAVPPQRVDVHGNPEKEYLNFLYPRRGGTSSMTEIHPAPLQIARQSMGEQSYRVKINRINNLLSYGLFDWAITDAEALEALSLLESMSSTERASALTEINISRLRENLPDKERPRLDTILRQTKGARANISKIKDLLSYGLLDWVITDKEALQALEILEAMPAEQRMHTLMSINRKRLYENLPAEGQDRLSLLWTEAHKAWERARQQGDPLEPGDRVQIYVYNRLGQELESGLSQTYALSEKYSLTLPLLGEVMVRGLKPSHIALKLEALLMQSYLRAPEVKVEVIQRRGERFKARELKIHKGQPESALDPGDSFELRVIDETNGEEETDFSRSFQIDNTGFVDLPHLGKTALAGLTRKEITLRIQSLLKNWYKRPPFVWVWVTSHAGNIYRAEKGLRPKGIKKHSTTEEVRKIREQHIPTRTQLDVYMDFFRAKQAELKKPELSQRDQQVGQMALSRYLDWLSAHSKDEAALAATNPWEIYGRIHTPLLINAIKEESRKKVFEKKVAGWEEERNTKVEKKLDEYWKWAWGRWQKASKEFKSVGRAYLLTEHSYRKISMNALTSAVLNWAYSNTSHPEFLTLSPLQVADRLLKEDPRLKLIVKVGMEARPRLEYFPEMDRTRYTLGELATEIMIGILPIAGEMQDASDLVTGVSITGHKLETSDRVLAGFALLIPFVPGAALRGGKKLPEIVSDFARVTGRSADEIEAVFRVAGHLDADDIKELDRIMSALEKGKKLTATDLDIIDDIARKLKKPLEEAASALKKGEAVKVGKLKVDPLRAKQLVPGTAEHMMQRWIEYQVRNPAAFPRLTNVIDPKWQNAYNTILRNAKKGSEFEQASLKALGHTKNNAMMISPEALGYKGFIPDAVKGNPTELVWGEAYHFIEVKGWKDMSLTGNLAKMLSYVDKYGGHIEVVFRSAKHAEGATKLSGPLEKLLTNLEIAGKATVIRYP